jgi:hypothetical protein
VSHEIIHAILRLVRPHLDVARRREALEEIVWARHALLPDDLVSLACALAVEQEAVCAVASDDPLTGETVHTVDGRGWDVTGSWPVEIKEAP